jgi:hypothetical protein
MLSTIIFIGRECENFHQAYRSFEKAVFANRITSRLTNRITSRITSRVTSRGDCRSDCRTFIPAGSGDNGAGCAIACWYQFYRSYLAYGTGGGLSG